MAAGLGVSGGKDADVGYNYAVARHRALNHVGKHSNNPFIKFKIDYILEGGRIEGIGFLCHSFVVLIGMGICKKS